MCSMCRPVFFDVIRFLLEHGAEVDALDNDHLTPLHMTLSQKGSVRAAQLQLQHGANVHIQNNEGETPVQVALRNGHEALMRLLLEHSQGVSMQEHRAARTKGNHEWKRYMVAIEWWNGHARAVWRRVADRREGFPHAAV